MNYQTTVENELAVTDSNPNAVLDLIRATYYQLNAKPDSMSKVFSRKVIISREDIIDLNKRINEKIKMYYRDDGYIANITVNMKDRQVIDFDCWEKFVEYDWPDVSCINSMVLKWHFNIRTPQVKMAQNHSVVVKLTNGLRPEELFNLIFSGKLEDIEEVEMGAFPIAVRVDFINTLLAEELLNIVAKWVEGLKQNEDLKNPLVLFCRKYRKKVAQCIEYISFIVISILGIGIVNKIINSFNLSYIRDVSVYQFRMIITALFVLAIFLTLIKGACESVATNVFDRLAEYGKVNVFNITKGDKNLQEKIEHSDKINGRRILIKIGASAAFNIICGILTALLMEGV